MDLEHHRYLAVVGYDGTDFLGYQVQARGRTVQGEIERALEAVTRTNIRIESAGRTDTGVHAIGQVIAFNATWRHKFSDLQRALNAVLPRDVVISTLRITNPRFHPRFDALNRSYRYTIVSQPWPDVLQRRYAWHIRETLDLTAMQEASRFLLGPQDFASFGKPTQGESTVRKVLQAEWLRVGNQIYFDISANAFLYRMVRTVVGTLVQVGLGRWPATEIKNILAARELTRSAPPAPAHGLCLMRVTYPEEV